MTSLAVKQAIPAVEVAVIEPFTIKFHRGRETAFRDAMASRAFLSAGAVAVALTSLVTGCASGTSLGVPPSTVIATVVANLPTVIGTIDRGGSSTTTSSSRSSSVPRRNIPSSPPPSAMASKILKLADQYVGTKYTWGGNTPREGFDCSGFTKYIFAKEGITLPRTSREQVRAGRAVPADFGSLRPGDLMMFAEPGEAISHVAIYAGDGVIIHSSGTTHGVGYTDLNTGGEWFVAYFVAARRLD